MTEPEIVEILKSLDAAIAGFENYRGRLTSLEVSVKSMLTISRGRLAGELRQASHATEVNGKQRG